MNQPITFPKEATYLKNQLLHASSYAAIAKMKDEVLKYAKYLQEQDILKCFEALFYTQQFPTIVTMIDELMKLEREALSYDYYVLASFIAMGDVYQARNFLHRSPLLKACAPYYQEGGANYSTILGLQEAALYRHHLTLVLAAFIVELTSERIEEADPMLYRLTRMMDLLNTLQELGYEAKTIKTLEAAIEIIFEIKL